MRQAALGWLLAGLGAATPALAQPELRPEPSQASQCVVATDPAREAPAYPFEAFRKGTPGRVKVQLRFSAPDQPPGVRVLESDGGWEFAQAVREWVKTLRTPCIGAGETLLEQEYLFRPFEERVNFGPLLDEPNPRRQALRACIRQPPGPSTPAYPHRALSQELQGRLHGRLTFDAPDRPPTLELLHRPSAAPFAASVRSWAQGYRLPCFDPVSDQPLTLTADFIFKLNDSEYGFKPMTLLQFMANVKGIREQPLKLDTHSMGCPFDLRLQYLMPQRPNLVGVRGEYRPEREPLLKWLRTAELNLAASALDAVYVDAGDIAVPCIRIDLQPKSIKE